MTIEQETDLINRAKKDIQFFEPLYDKYYEKIFRFTYSKINNKELAFDLTEDVFLKAMENIKQYTDRGYSFGTWLYRIAYNLICDTTRVDQNCRVVNIDATALNNLSEDFEITISESQYVKLEKALKAIKPEALELIELRYFNNQSFKEMGVLLGITERNAKVKTYRALDKLKTFFTKNN